MRRVFRARGQEGGPPRAAGRARDDRRGESRARGAANRRAHAGGGHLAVLQRAGGLARPVREVVSGENRP